MKKEFKKNNIPAIKITYKGIEYAFIVGSESISVRRIDQSTPDDEEVSGLTNYLIMEGWADHLLEDLVD